MNICKLTKINKGYNIQAKINSSDEENNSYISKKGAWLDQTLSLFFLLKIMLKTCKIIEIYW